MKELEVVGRIVGTVRDGVHMDGESSDLSPAFG